MLYHGLPSEQASKIELQLEHLAINPCENNLGCIEDSLLDAMPKIREDERLFWWKTYYTALKVYLNYAKR